jgi:hypothetical protein
VCAVFADAFGKMVLHRFAASHSGEDLVQLSLTLLRDEKGDVAADRFAGAIAVEELSGRVPRQDRAVEPLGDNGIVRRLNDGGEE